MDSVDDYINNKVLMSDRSFFNKKIRKIIDKWYTDPLANREDLISQLTDCFEKSRKRLRRF